MKLKNLMSIMWAPMKSIRDEQIKFEKSMNDVRNITNENGHTKKITDLLIEAREHYVSIPKHYPGDHEIINLIKWECLKGYTLIESISRVTAYIKTTK